MSELIQLWYVPGGQIFLSIVALLFGTPLVTAVIFGRSFVN